MGKQTSSKQQNIPMLNARNMCRIMTLEGMSSPSKNGESSCKIYVKWIYVARHETISGYIAGNQSQGSQHEAQ